MSAPAIRVDNLGKSYVIRHQEGGRAAPGGLLSEQIGRWLTGRWGRGTAEEFWALKGVGFELQRGEVLGVIGRNGAGKSTLLKILSRITEPTEGRAELRGRVASLLEVGTGFHPELTGRENIFLNGAILGMTRREIRAKFDEIVDFSGVEKFLDTPVKRYSSGMHVRLAFAVAAHLEPEILVIDEVLAVGDAAFQQKCLGKMRAVAEGHGRTVLFVSHNMSAVVSLCSRVLYLAEGRTVEDGAPEDVVRNYLAALQAGSGQDDLTRMERQGAADHPRVFRRVRLNGTPLGEASVGVGQEAVFTIDAATHEDTDVVLALRDELGTRIGVLHSHYHSAVRIPGGRQVRLTCRVPELPLVPGTYAVDLVAISGYQVVERLEHVGSFNVYFQDWFGTGNLPPARDGRILLQAEWAQADAAS